MIVMTAIFICLYHSSLLMLHGLFLEEEVEEEGQNTMKFN